jgi:hypothetical protein
MEDILAHLGQVEASKKIRVRSDLLRLPDTPLSPPPLAFLERLNTLIPYRDGT